MIRRPRDERGVVTAELALALPLLVGVTLGLVWLLSVGAAQVRVVDAAREAARGAARGDDVGSAVAAGERVAPEGGTVTVSTVGSQVRALATARVSGPGGLFGFLPGLTVHAEAVALAEDPP